MPKRLNISNKKDSTSLTIAIVVTIFTAVVFLFLFLFLGINHRKDVYNNSKELASEISRKAAFETQIYLSSSILIARSLEQNILLIRKLKNSRQEIKRMLKTTISENPNFLGVWTLWEPDAFDGKDYLYRDDSLYNDQGTLGISYFRERNEINYEIMTLADYNNSYYLLPKELKDEIITEPYNFAYTGYKQVFFATSISIPIIVDDKFLGVIGVDIDLGSLQNKLSKVRPYQTGYLSLISNNGKIVTHIDSSLINKKIFDVLDKQDTLSYNAIVNGKELTVETRSEFTGKKVFRLFYPIDVSRSKKPWSMMIEIPIEKAASLSKKILFVAIGTLFVGLSLFLYMIINIAERRKYEKALLAAKTQADESNRLKTAFLNNISHEIRTPLNGILGFTELLIDSDTKEEDALAYKEIIHNSSNQLLSIIANVIELSKIQANQGKVVIHEFDIKKAMNKVVETFNSTAKEKNLELVTNFPGNEQKHYISTDEEKFMQVLTYLLSNAIKFTHDGFVEIGYSVQKKSYLFHVKDTGIGIKPENVEDIFNYFNQEEMSLARNYGGLGVGLSISKSLINLLKGSIYLESEEGKGSTFYFTLPSLS
ncbi:ATP-binding protein [Bacteroidota bacterium]